MDKQGAVWNRALEALDPSLLEQRWEAEWERLEGQEENTFLREFLERVEQRRAERRAAALAAGANAAEASRPGGFRTTITRAAAPAGGGDSGGGSAAEEGTAAASLAARIAEARKRRAATDAFLNMAEAELAAVRARLAAAAEAPRGRHRARPRSAPQYGAAEPSGAGSAATAAAAAAAEAAAVDEGSMLVLVEGILHGPEALGKPQRWRRVEEPGQGEAGTFVMEELDPATGAGRLSVQYDGRLVRSLMREMKQVGGAGRGGAVAPAQAAVRVVQAAVSGGVQRGARRSLLAARQLHSAQGAQAPAAQACP